MEKPRWLGNTEHARFSGEKSLRMAAGEQESHEVIDSKAVSSQTDNAWRFPTTPLTFAYMEGKIRTAEIEDGVESDAWLVFRVANHNLYLKIVDLNELNGA